MLKNQFDPKKPYRFVRYGRMSDPGQNPRSPEQQFDTIDRTLQQLRLPWVHLTDYRDDAISGRYTRKRPGYQELMRDLQLGTLKVDLILVDNIERFARAHEIPHRRARLIEKFGVLVLTSDTNFCDPQSPQGNVMGAFEALRATEEGRIKARQVLRGKRDAAKQKHWPGGPPPFGYKLENVMTTKNGVEVISHRVLVPGEETDWIVKLMFGQARETAWGQTKLARWLNQHPEVPATFKPFKPATVGYILKNEIYYGELVWEKYCTDILDDTRVKQRNPDEEVLRIPGFCAGLVAYVDWKVINDRRRQRAAAIRAAREAKVEQNGKLLAASVPGLVVNYPLTGLVRCGHCGRAMTISSAPEYITKDGIRRRYSAYVCTGHATGACPNSQRVPESWLRAMVFKTLLARLFPLHE